MEFLRVVIGAVVLQGYGLTETCAATCVTEEADICLGHVGPPVPCCEVKLEDVPEMGYTKDDKPYPRGEVCVRGPNVFRGYYKNEEATKGALVDGWLHTGDVGRWNPNGTLSIIDRKKNIFKLSQGEYIAAEKIETVYAKSPLVGQCWVYGNSYKSFVVSVIVPNAEPLSNICKEKGWWGNDAADYVVGSSEFCEHFHKVCQGDHKADINKIVFDSIKEQNKHLKGFEKVKAIFIESEIDALLTGFTEVNQCMTPTFKLRRPYLLKRYVKHLKEMYTALGSPPNASEKWGGE
jgi:long-chain acyl-CoA synthetase